MGILIFDFDGTIADSFEVVTEIFHELTGHEHRLGAEAVERLRGKPAHVVARELGIRWWRLPWLLHRGRRSMHARIAEIKPFAGVPSAIRQLHEEGNRLYILSSNSASNIREFLRAHQLEHYFEDVQGGIGLFGKVTALKRIVSKHHLKIRDCTYVGDEVRDVFAAKRVGMRAAVVAWGYNNRRVLAAADPDTMVDTPAQLVRALGHA